MSEGTSKGIETMTLVVSILALGLTSVNSCYVMGANKDYAEADKARADTVLLQMKTTPRANVTASMIDPKTTAWGEHKDLCTLTGLYELRNVGDAPIKIARLSVNLYEVELGAAPDQGQRVRSISFATRLKTSPLFHEDLPDSEGVVLPGETYSRAYGYIVQRDAAKQYAIEASPQPAVETEFKTNAFRAWSALTGVCNP